ncbi:hypothetical protein CDV50_14910 [Haematobacter massiliensis]|uniref:Flagellar biosynthesis protein n=1 Tax=Haematobacter massiliensis TaxID=195105 RepID=A0A086Y0U0_9RHOB|nr:FliH/SctL family protein [Haematobacter massiliensis]KFI27890.1 flagellar biosynthesis protein [Haematobacter massiliensis]OWJ69956.1 hypothetical protein CDV50_14910 [Haematobacter massiliensis]OWJ87159.1 hypothetical protein CDV51_07965 [Haematobacter massiliensis]QBJ25190.1 hypothetical protein HmaOT1_13610 [Haematobacter massiliensis]
MKPLALTLENFATFPQLAEEDALKAQACAYDEGFAAGWEEAVAAEVSERARLRTDLDARLQDLSLTWQEARDHALSALSPVLEALVAKVLPTVAQTMVAELILEHFAPIARQATQKPVALAVCPEDVAALQARLQDHDDLPFQIVADDTLLPGQCVLRSAAETLFDLDGLTQRLTEEIRNHYPQSPELRAHG